MWPIKAQAKDIVVVLDPGHGGEADGGRYDEKGFIEKDLTILVAEAMKEELEKYDGIKVYMTRTEDKDLTLKQRVDVAKSVNADFFFCLHFNMSSSHMLYGSECWISAFGNCYAKGYDFSKYEMDELTDLGLYDRGIKTRIGKKGTDYYGIIRHATEAGIPSVIIEHAHMDNAEDWPFLDYDQWPKTYGKSDATAVAKYFGLKSEILGVDYSTLEHENTSVPSGTMRPDSTEPVCCTVNSYNVDEETGIVSMSITSYDDDTRMLYYAYSFDGGQTFEPFQKWPNAEDRTINVDIQLPNNRDVDLVVMTHNLYDLVAMSESFSIGAIDYEAVPVVPEVLDVNITPVVEEEEPFSLIKIFEDVLHISTKKEEESESLDSEPEFVDNGNTGAATTISKSKKDMSRSGNIAVGIVMFGIGLTTAIVLYVGGRTKRR